MRKKIDKIHHHRFMEADESEALDKLNQWIDDNPEDVVVINIQIERLTKLPDVMLIYHLFYGIKDKEI